MRVYKDEGEKFYRADIWVGGKKHRFFSGLADRRAAQKAADDEKDRLTALCKSTKAAGASLQIADVAARYMLDVGDHHAGKDNTDRLVRLLVEYFGETKVLTEITHDNVLALRRWRREHKVGTGKQQISAYTVNDTIEQLKKLFTYLKPGVQFPDEPEWKKLWLDERKARPRQLVSDESERLDAAILELRQDYWPLFEFVRTVGKRKTNCYTLEWDQVDFDGGEITMRAKGRAGGKVITIKITPSIRAILWPLYQTRHENAGCPQASARVFTFTAQRTVDKVIRGHRHAFVAGKRYPITRDGLRRVWGTIRTGAALPLKGEQRFRFHDLRHDFASKLLREVDGLHGIKVLQTALDHADIKTTLDTYSHLLESDTPDAIERLATTRKHGRRKNRPENRPEKKLKVV